MRRLANPVHHRIAHVDVARRHVDLGAQHVRAVLELARAHAAEEVVVLGDRAIAVRAIATGFCQRAAIFAHLVGRQAVDVRLAISNELLGPLVELLEIVRRVIQMLAPIEAEPLDVALDLVDVFLRFLDRVRVVEPEIAAAAELLRHAEVDADRLGVADVQAAVRFRGKPRDDGGSVFAGLDVLCDDFANEIAGRRFRSVFGAWARHSERPILAYGRIAGQCDAPAVSTPGLPRRRERMQNGRHLDAETPRRRDQM